MHLNMLFKNTRLNHQSDICKIELGVTIDIVQLTMLLE